MLLDWTTDRAPSFGPKVFQPAFVGLFGSRMVSGFFLRKYQRQWESLRAKLLSSEADSTRHKILLLADVCIGDSVLDAECLKILRQTFPFAEIHYGCHKTGGELIEGMPGVWVHNIIVGDRGFPTEQDISRLQSLFAEERFSVVLNMGPFLGKDALGSDAQMIQLYVPFAAYVFRAWKQNRYRHISYLSRAFFSEFLAVGSTSIHGTSLKGEHREPLNTNTVYLSRAALSLAKTFLDDWYILPNSGIVFFNPDATSQFGQIPFEVQATLLRKVTELEQISAVLIGKAYTSVDIEQGLIATLSDVLKKKVHIVPHIPIEAYTALIDASDMYISGDTGPLHIAACRKLGEDNRPLRNRTAVIAIYGATDSRMYGYDSEQPFHAPANQDVPSRSFSAPAPCRNITCVNKFGKSCTEVRCFGSATCR